MVTHNGNHASNQKQPETAKKRSKRRRQRQKESKILVQDGLIANKFMTTGIASSALFGTIDAFNKNRDDENQYHTKPYQGSSSSIAHSLTNMVRRISLNILNGSGVDSDSNSNQQHQYRSASAAAGSFHHHNYHDSELLNTTNDESMMNNSTNNDRSTNTNSSTGSISSTYSYLSDLFPHNFLPKSLKINLKQTSSTSSTMPLSMSVSSSSSSSSSSSLSTPSTDVDYNPSTFDSLDYVIDDYETIDFGATMDGTKSTSSIVTDQLIPFATTSTNTIDGSSLSSTTSDLILSNVDTFNSMVSSNNTSTSAQPSSSSSADMFIRLMRGMLKYDSFHDVDDYARTNRPLSTTSSSMAHHHHHHHHRYGYEPSSPLTSSYHHHSFASHLLSDPISSSSVSLSSSSASASAISSSSSAAVASVSSATSSLIPSLMSSSSNSVTESGTSTAAAAASTAILGTVSDRSDPSQTGTSAAAVAVSSTSSVGNAVADQTNVSESSSYHNLFRLFQEHHTSNQYHHGHLSSVSSSNSNGTIPAAISALTSSQLVAASSYDNPPGSYYNSLMENQLTANITSTFTSTMSSAFDSTASTVLAASAAANSGIVASSSSYYSSELSSASSSSSSASYATMMMDEFASTATNGIVGSGAAGIGTFDGPLDWLDILFIVIKILVLGTIILSAIFGNLLVIISVLRHHRLRITTNYFIVSLALADILVALFAMTFNASVVISGRWLFDMWVCDFWNSCDVLFSTASIMHLSCISYDRYYAIIKPLDYPMKVTTKRVYFMIGCVWFSSALISYIPIFTGIYTTEDAMQSRVISPDTCEWVVNIPYALISSTVSFWLPCGFMLTAYYKIYQEALKQEKFIYKTQQMANVSNHHQHHPQAKKEPKKSSDQQHLNAPRHSSVSENNVIQIQSGGHRNSHAEDPESGSSTPTKRTISKMKREHKAAKTLGIIMGAFILCWLPFFIWYVTSTICGSNCNTPKVIVDLLFWVGYLNSAMNPIIYAYFNREFREAFKETLRNLICCCLGLRCLEQQRTDAISFS